MMVAMDGEGVGTMVRLWMFFSVSLSPAHANRPSRIWRGERMMGGGIAVEGIQWLSLALALVTRDESGARDERRQAQRGTVRDMERLWLSFSSLAMAPPPLTITMLVNRSIVSVSTLQELVSWRWTVREWELDGVERSVCKVRTQDPENFDEEVKSLLTAWRSNNTPSPASHNHSLQPHCHHNPPCCYQTHWTSC